MKRRLLVFALSLLLAACGSDDKGDPWNDLVGRSWTVAAGAGDFFECTGVKVASDMYITGFRTQATQMGSAGNYGVMLTVDDDPAPQLGDYDCDGVIFPAVRLVYASGRGTDELRFPAGVGVHVKAGQHLLLNVHVVNGQALSGSTRVQVLTGGPSDVQQDADLTLSGTTNINNIAADGMPHMLTGGCVAGSDWTIFAFMPQMHGAGTHQTVRLNGASIFDSDYSSSQPQLFDVPATPIAIHQGDQILTTCTWVNNTGSPLFFGTGLTGELCYGGLYRYPAPANANFFDCTSH